VPDRQPDQDYFRGVAAVPQRPRSAPGDTGDLPRVEQLSPTLPDAAPLGRRPMPPPRGMIVRRRGRRLRSGAGWTWTGVTFAVVCWGIWVVSVRGTDLVGPVIGLVLVLATALLMFVLARLLGRTVLEGALGRDRPTAWPSHLTVCVFLTMAGITFLQQTLWIKDSWRSAGDSWQWLVDTWDWLIGLWPG
jgi:hypothetical protein